MIVDTTDLARSLARLVTFFALATTAAATEHEPETLHWQAISGGGNYLVSLAPREQRIPIGRHHDWVLGLTSASGGIVSGARLRLTGGMPGHGHGMPSQPLVTEELRPGQYRVEGMQFNMHGQWQIVIGIDGQAGPDRADFLLTVGY